MSDDHSKTLPPKLDAEMKKLHADPLYFMDGSLYLREYKPAALFAVEKYPYLLEYASYTLRDDIEVVTAALKGEDKEKIKGVVQYASFDVRTNKSFMLEHLKKIPSDIQYLSPSLRGDRDLAMLVVRKCGQLLEYCFATVQDDPEVVKAAVEHEQDRVDDSDLEYVAFKFASDRLKNTLEAVEHAVDNNGHAILHANKRLRENKQVALRAVQENGYALQHLCEALRDDKDVVLAAVENSGYALQYASDRLREDLEVLYAATNCNDGIGCDVLEYMSNIFLTDIGKAKQLMKSLPEAYGRLPDHFKLNRDLCLSAVRRDPESVLPDLPPSLCGDEEIALAALKNQFQDNVYDLLPREMQCNLRVVIEAYKQHPEMAKDIPTQIKNTAAVRVLLGVDLDKAEEDIRSRKRKNELTSEDFDAILDAATTAAKRHRAALTATGSILEAVVKM